MKAVCHPQWSRVKRAFEANFRELNEVGGSVCVFHNGEIVVHLWHGDKVRGASKFTHDTLCNVFSATKGVAAACMMKLVDGGRLAYSDRVSKYWPEFAQNGKAHITVEQLLSHQGGLSHLDAPGVNVDLIRAAQNDPDGQENAKLLSILEQQEPHDSPLGYSPFVVGLYVCELVRRVDVKRRTIREFFLQEIGAPLRMDFHFGVEDRRTEQRIARLYELENNQEPQDVDPQSLAYRAYQSIQGFTPWRARDIQLPSALGFTTAKSLATLYNEIITPYHHLWRQKTINSALTPTVSGNDAVLGVHNRVCRGGFMLYDDQCIGHGGAGGSIGCAFPNLRVACGYTTNALEFGGDEARKRVRLLQAIEQCALECARTSSKL